MVDLGKIVKILEIGSVFHIVLHNLSKIHKLYKYKRSVEVCGKWDQPLESTEVSKNYTEKHFSPRIPVHFHLWSQAESWEGMLYKKESISKLQLSISEI